MSNASLSQSTTKPIEQRASANQTCTRACPVCGGTLFEIRHKLHCQRCHTIVETCCEGGRG